MDMVGIPKVVYKVLFDEINSVAIDLNDFPTQMDTMVEEESNFFKARLEASQKKMVTVNAPLGSSSWSAPLEAKELRRSRQLK